jgi:predicted AAA+ superfamily ATPase
MGHTAYFFPNYKTARYIYPYILKDLKKKMVFIGGPRQVGKTTLAKAVLEDHFPSGRYFNK